MFQSRMFPGEKRFRLGSPCTAVTEGAFSRGCGRGRSAYGERMKEKPRQGGVVRNGNKACGCLKK